MHSVEPLITLKLPASHAAHCPPSGPVYPALHRQSVTTPLPVSELDRFPAGHAMHTVPALTLSSPLRMPGTVPRPAPSTLQGTSTPPPQWSPAASSTCSPLCC
eukprot:2950370-Rhodomonas_salina.1